MNYIFKRQESTKKVAEAKTDLKVVPSIKLMIKIPSEVRTVPHNQKMTSNSISQWISLKYNKMIKLIPRIRT